MSQNNGHVSFESPREPKRTVTMQTPNWDSPQPDRSKGHADAARGGHTTPTFLRSFSPFMGRSPAARRTRGLYETGSHSPSRATTTLTRLATLMNRPGARATEGSAAHDSVDQQRVKEALEYMARKDSVVHMQDLTFVRKLGEGGFAFVELWQLKSMACFPLGTSSSAAGGVHDGPGSTVAASASWSWRT